MGDYGSPLLGSNGKSEEEIARQVQEIAANIDPDKVGDWQSGLNQKASGSYWQGGEDELAPAPIPGTQYRPPPAISSLPKTTQEELTRASEIRAMQKAEGDARMKQAMPEGWPHATLVTSQGKPWGTERSISNTGIVPIPANVDPVLPEMLAPIIDSPKGSEAVDNVKPGVIVDSVLETPDPEHPLHPWVGKFIQQGSKEHREYAVAQLLLALGVDLKDPNFTETPRRVAAYMSEHFRTEAQVNAEILALKRAVFPSKYGDMVTEREIKTSGMCPHHLLPVQYTVDVGYLPGKHVIGISKLARIPMLLAGLPILQEDYTHQIAAAMQQVLEVQDVAVVVKGVHMCMVVRGVEQEESDTVTSVMCGKFLDNFRDCKNEFLALARK